MIEDALRDPD
jgi:hypothetical protein